MPILLIALVIVLYTLQSLFCKNYSDNYPGERSDATPVFTIVSGLVTVAVSFIFSGFKFSAEPLTVLFGIINAFILFGYNYFLINASAKGAYSAVMVFSIGGGIIIPAVVSVAFGDTLSIIQIAAILVILISVYLISNKKDAGSKDSQESKASTLGFIALCFGLGVCNGVYGTLIDVQQRLTSPDQREEMAATTYLVAALIAFVILLYNKRGKAFASFRQTRKSLIYLILCSIIVACAVNLLVLILEFVDTTVLYTFDNAGTMLFSVICSCIFYREKLSAMNIIGCVTMCLGLVALSAGNEILALISSAA